jgi:hypothetical protein
MAEPLTRSRAATRSSGMRAWMAALAMDGLTRDMQSFLSLVGAHAALRRPHVGITQPIAPHDEADDWVAEYLVQRRFRSGMRPG